MPTIVYPLGLNVLILSMAWLSQLSIAVKMLITASVIVKFSLYFYSTLVSDSEWLEIVSLVVSALFNAAIVALGLIYNVMTMVVPPVLLVIVFLIWIILPRTVVIQEKEGSRE